MIFNAFIAIAFATAIFQAATFLGFEIKMDIFITVIIIGLAAVYCGLHTLSDCHEVFGDEIDRTVAWKDGESVKQLAGTPVRLRFVLKDADLFSFRFR